VKAAALLGVCAVLLVASAVMAARWAGTEGVVAAFTTDLADRSPVQRENIVIAAARLDGALIRPGETFSFNGRVGQRLIDEGYRKAPTYVEGGVADTPGGGICQLSSTVYNAALRAGLRIVERSAHASKVFSVGPGLDATVAYGHCDLRFANPYPWPVRLRARTVGERLVVEVLAAHPLPASVEVRVERQDLPHSTRTITWRRTGGVEEEVSEDVYR
jgi:vancomycin resistance protein YoaR